MSYNSPKRQAFNPLLTLVGLAMTVPAFFWLWATFLQPLQTLLTWSAQNINPVRSGDPQFVGSANFEAIFNDPSFSKTLQFTLLLIGGRLLAVVLVPPLLGWTLSRFGRGLRFTIRLLLTLPLVFFAPVITALSWRYAFNPALGLFQNTTALSRPEDAVATLQFIDFITSFGIACALGVFAYVVAFRPLGGEGARRGTRRGFIALWMASLALAVTTVLQSFTLVIATTNGGPANATRTIPFWFYQTSFVQFRFGTGAALSVLCLSVIATLGLLVGLYIILSNIALIDFKPRRFRVLGRSVAFLIMALLFVGALISILVNLLPVLWLYLTVQNATAPQILPLNQALLNTLLPPLQSIMLQLPILYLGALGIGALRPLGRYSSLLLLPFSPFLFMTMFLFSTVWYNTLRVAGMVSTTTAMGYSTGLLNVGALFILTLYFKGQTALWDRESYPGIGGFIRVVVLPSIPLVLLIVALAVGIGAQDVSWPMIINQTQGNQTTNVILLTASLTFVPGRNEFAALLTQFGLIFNAIYFVALLIFGTLYLDRLALGTPNTLRDALRQVEPPTEELQ